MIKKIGGFFGLDLDSDSKPNSLPHLWDLDKYTHWMFANGRSALHQLLLQIKPTTFWLPAYACTSLAQAAQNITLKFYPLNENFSPDVDYLKTHLAAGDAVLAIDYFGRNPDAAFLAFRRTMREVHWIEDRAQALLPASKAWGDYVLYSPRKLLGVADGGILVGITKPLPTPHYAGELDDAFIAPARMRYEDKSEMCNKQWYEAYVATENSHTVSNVPMSQTSRKIFASVNAKQIMTKRITNYTVLMNALESIALLPENDMSFVPLGFPIRIKNRQKLATALHAQGIFAAQHWPELPAPSSFKNEHTLAAELLTLPCDQRYNADDMTRVAEAVQRAL